ncbi:hypothetical protein HEM57_023710 [Escherichia coli]|nr:hypothetical protein [Escherichia coli]
MVDTNVCQQEEIKAVCSTFPEQCQQQYGYLVEQWEAIIATSDYSINKCSERDCFCGD